MSDQGPQTSNDDQLLEEAASWFARMRGPDAEASQADFEAWLARGALHRAAYNRASEIFAMGKLLADEDSGQAEAEAPAPARSRRPATVLAGAAALLLCLGTASLLLRPGWRPGGGGIPRGLPAQAPRLIILATGPRETRAARLADGSVVTLQGQSSLAISLDAQWRRLVLSQGSARFDVAHEARPFIVRAGGGSVTARGTIFDIGLSPDRRVSVKLIQGVIDVSLPPPPHSSPQEHPRVRRLRSGESLSFPAEADANGANGRAPRGTAAAISGRLRDYDNVRLADIVAEANRGHGPQIVLAGAALGERRVSGRFRIDDPLVLADRLAALFDLAVEPGGGTILLR